MFNLHFENMKAYNYFKILFLSLTCVKAAKAQVPFTDYLCSSDTLFNSAKRFSNTVNSTTIINSLKTSNFADGQLNGEITYELSSKDYAKIQIQDKQHNAVVNELKKSSKKKKGKQER